MKIDTTNMCSPLQKKLLELDGIYYHILQAIQQDDTLTTVVRSRQLHIGIKFLYFDILQNIISGF